MDVAGPSFPFRIEESTGGVAWSEDKAKIAENVRLVLSTRHGERPMSREFGTTLHQLVHEPNDGALGRLLVKQARDALMQLEPRIIVTDVSIRQDGPCVVLDIAYIAADRPQADVMSISLG
jgi:phage baseplate assembly protein W